MAVNILWDTTEAVILDSKPRSKPRRFCWTASDRPFGRSVCRSLGCCLMSVDHTHGTAGARVMTYGYWFSIDSLLIFYWFYLLILYDNWIDGGPVEHRTCLSTFPFPWRNDKQVGTFGILFALILYELTHGSGLES
jgi:hypothetical protein